MRVDLAMITALRIREKVVTYLRDNPAYYWMDFNYYYVYPPGIDRARPLDPVESASIFGPVNNGNNLTRYEYRAFSEVIKRSKI